MTGLRILVIDDNRDGGDMLAVLLRQLGHHSLASYDADTGLAVAKGFKPQLILLDLAMPKKSGFDLLPELRNGAGFGDTPIIAVSGYVDAAHRKAANEAAFDGFLAKPFTLEELKNVLRPFTEADPDDPRR